MKILITGITGFVGSHLADYLLKQIKEAKVFGIKRWRSKTETVNHLDGRITYYECDLKDAHNVYQVIDKVRPDKIFHLAAQSFVPASWASPTETFETNIIGQCNLFEAVRKVKTDQYNPVIQIACSSEEYGLVKKGELPIKEENPLRPLSPYAVSKVAQDFMGYQYHRSYQMRIIRTRAFNHTGPRRGEVFVCSNFAKQIAEIEKGVKEPVIKVGNLESIRDFIDVRDVVQAYWLATEKCEMGEVYNIATGKGYVIREILDKLLALSKKKVKIEKDPSRLRPSDVMELVGDSTKFRKATGWEPKIPIEKSLEDLLNYWREKLNV